MRTLTRSALLVIFALALLALPTYAHAQVLGGCCDDTSTGPDNQNNTGTCDTMDADQCMWSSMGSQGGTYYYCTAKKSWGGACIAYTRLTNGANGCARVEYQANCQCDPVKKTSTGMCTFAP